MSKQFKLLSSAAIGTIITNTLANLKATDEGVHIGAVQATAHAEKHGDWTLLKRLMVGLKESGYRFQGVRVWIEAHSPLRFPADAKADGGFTVKVMRSTDDGYTPFNIAAMWETSFKDYAPSNERAGRPIYTDGFVGLVAREKARFLRLLDNTTADGQPKDASKDYFRGDAAAALRYLADLEAVKAPEDRTKLEDEKLAERQAEAAILGGDVAPAAAAAA